MRDYDSVVKSLRCCVSDSEPCEHCNCELEECNPKTIMEIAADAIEELLAKVPNWISVEDEPPKEKGDYWCNVRSYNFDDTYYQHEVWFDGEFFVIDGVCTDRVTHWMPLPEPPKEETE